MPPPDAEDPAFILIELSAIGTASGIEVWVLNVNKNEISGAFELSHAGWREAVNVLSEFSKNLSTVLTEKESCIGNFED